ncbi:hypothetical protein KEM52_004269, partial [Ascosphaera acerosa]
HVLPSNELCPRLPAECEHCSETFTKETLPAHAETCPLRPWPCGAHTIGCPFVAASDAERAQHESSCIFARLAPAVRKQEQALHALQQQVDALRQKNELLQDVLRDRGEFGTVDRAFSDDGNDNRNPSVRRRLRKL